MQRLPTIPKRLLAFAGAVAAIATGLVGYSSSASADPQPPTPQLSLPAPTGGYRVGTTAIELRGPVAGRQLMVQIWYPTQASEGRAASYFPPKTRQFAAQAFGVPASLIASIDTHAFRGVAPATGAHPVVAFSPGENGLRSDSTALETDLASHGYVVIGTDIPGESALVEYPDGHVVRGTFKDTGDASRAAAVRVRVADLRSVLKSLTALNRRGLLRGRLDLNRVGMFGFSLGGATAADAMRVLPAIRAGVDLDGSLYGHALTTPLKRPFMLLARDGHTNASDRSWQHNWTLLKGFRREIRVVGAGHENFTDNAAFATALGLSDKFTPAEIGPIPPFNATRAERQILSAFFDRFLRGQANRAKILNAPQLVNPDLRRIR